MSCPHDSTTHRGCCAPAAGPDGKKVAPDDPRVEPARPRAERGAAGVRGVRIVSDGPRLWVRVQRMLSRAAVRVSETARRLYARRRYIAVAANV